MQKVICPYCNSVAELIDSKIIFGKSYGMIYVCDKCEARVGCHRGTNKPLGTLANRELRTLRADTHRHFDPIWKQSIIKNARSIAYSRLAKKLNIPKHKCHIGMFDLDRCKKTIQLCRDIGITA